MVFLLQDLNQGGLKRKLISKKSKEEPPVLKTVTKLCENPLIKIQRKVHRQCCTSTEETSTSSALKDISFVKSERLNNIFRTTLQTVSNRTSVKSCTTECSSASSGKQSESTKQLKPVKIKEHTKANSPRA